MSEYISSDVLAEEAKKLYSELKDKIDKYVYYYNTSRYQWNKNMLAPIEIREQLKSYNTYPF